MKDTPSGLRRLLRRLVRAGLVVSLVVLVLLVATFTFDIGRIGGLRERAEREASKFLKRPMHIGRIGIHLASGHFVVEDILIEGLTPQDKPFFTAKRIEVDLYWWSLLRRREVLVNSLTLSDWEMFFENRNGQHNFPNVKPQGGGGPRRFTTTLTYVHAERGRFTYIDHGSWSTVAPNLDVQVMNVNGTYVGKGRTKGGETTIRQYEPMWTDMSCSFTIEGSNMHLDRIDLLSDGAVSVLDGDVPFGRWPEMHYRVKSRVQFPRMKQIFFGGERFTVDGQGDFEGTFDFFRGGRELKGRFSSDLVHLNAVAFPNLRGSLAWLPNRFDVYDASSDFFGGRTSIKYSIAPLGSPEPTRSRLETGYEHVDLAALSDFMEMRGLRLNGRASGFNTLEYPLGHFPEHRGEGRVRVDGPDGVRMYSRTALLPVSAIAREALGELAEDVAPPPLGYVPLSGEFNYRYGPEWIEVDPSHVATETTFVEFRGRTAYGERSEFPFYARSADWQESDRLLAGVLTAFGSKTGTIAVGGHGAFEGRMLHSFRKPRIEGTFSGDNLKAWRVVWGSGRGRIVVEDGYVDVAEAEVTRHGSTIRAEGRFSLGFPRKDGGEEINTRVRMTDRPLGDLRRAFELDAYPLDGKVSGEYHVYGRYKRPYGYGTMVVTDAVVYGEPLERASASLRLEGVGVRMDGIEMLKGGGTVNGAAYVSWDGRYSFNVNGQRVPMESVVFVNYPQAPLSGMLTFTANGTGEFANPRYEAKLQISDLFVSDEGIGQVHGELRVRDEMMTVELDAASSRLQVTGTGKIAMTSDLEGELSFRFTDTSLDPYVRTFQPNLSPFTSAVASGTVRAVGRLMDPSRLLVEASVERLDLRLFDYHVRNQNPLKVSFDNQTVRVNSAESPARFVGEGTQLDLSGEIDLEEERIAARARGDANLGILQGFYRNIRSTGKAELTADIRGRLREPVLSGSASIADGRIRYFSLPHAIEAINGAVRFQTGGIIVDPARPLTATLGGGRVIFGGMIELDAFVPRQLSLTAAGTGMRLRFPEGFRTLVDASLDLVGPVTSPTLKGTVDVRSSVWRRRVDIGTGLLEIVAAANAARGAPPAAGGSALPLTLDVHVIAPASSLRVQNNLANIMASADLTLRGTLDRPVLFGRAQIERGDAIFEGKRYVITHGTVDFSNPTRIEPFFDFEAETRVRAPGQTYLVDVRAYGRTDRLQYQLTSDPPLPQIDVLALLFSDVATLQDADIRALDPGRRAQADLVRTRAAQLLASPVASNLGRFVERALGLTTFQITPSFVDPYQQLYPTARLTIGHRLSNRVYLTYSQNLSSNQTIWLMEYDATDRLSWVLSRNEDGTYALDARMRHAF